ncbi:MAG: S41 family peptidase [Planctomycetota bacterium]
MESGLGYIATYSVSQASRAAYDAALEDLADCPGLILDMRLNGGGGHSGVEALHRKRGSWSKPVAVLMGPKTMSQGETEIWSIREMRDQRMCNARLFGQTTAGSSGRKAQFELPSGFASGQFVIDHWNNGSQTIEGQGIEPDEVVLQDIVELSRGIDSCRRAAEAWLRGQAGG